MRLRPRSSASSSSVRESHVTRVFQLRALPRNHSLHHNPRAKPSIAAGALTSETLNPELQYPMHTDPSPSRRSNRLRRPRQDNPTRLPTLITIRLVVDWAVAAKPSLCAGPDPLALSQAPGASRKLLRTQDFSWGTFLAKCSLETRLIEPIEDSGGGSITHLIRVPLLE